MRFPSLKNYCLLAAIAGWISLSFPSWAMTDQDMMDQDSKAKSLAAYTMGVVEDLKGSTDKAVEEFQKSLQYQDNYAAHLRLGADYARQGDLTAAILELKRVLELDKDNIQAHYMLALVYSTQKQYDKAAGEYEAILTSMSQIDPKNVEIYGYLAQLYYSQKQYHKAIEQFEKILTIDKQNADMMFLLGCLYLEVHQRQKAIDLFSRAIMVNPEHDTSLNSLGYVYAEQGENLDEAQRLIERALKIDPKNGAYFDSLGWVYFKKGDYAEALRYLNQADSLITDPIVYEHMGDVYFKMKQDEEAKKFWTKSLELLPNQEKVIEKLKSIQ